MNLRRLLLAAAIAAGLFFGLMDVKAEDLACPETQYYLQFGDQIAFWEPNAEDLNFFKNASNTCFEKTGKSCVIDIIVNIETSESSLGCANPEQLN